jgi:hypothetical protein
MRKTTTTRRGRARRRWTDDNDNDNNENDAKGGNCSNGTIIGQQYSQPRDWHPAYKKHNKKKLHITSSVTAGPHPYNPKLHLLDTLPHHHQSKPKNKTYQPQIPLHNLLIYPLTLTSTHHPTTTAPVHIPQLVRTSQLLTASHNLRSL